MTHWPTKSRWSTWTTWTCECLARERAIAIACAIEPSSASAYSSAVKSYFNFCSLHSFPVDPTPDTLSFFTVYTAHYIKPESVLSYLSGICNQLEPFFPNVRSHRHHWLVTKTLAGCWKMFPSAVLRKWPVTRAELVNISQQYSSSSSFGNTLALAILLTGFHGLMQLGELTWLDNKYLQDYCKVFMCNSVQVNPGSFQFMLSGHKADYLFEGSLVLIQSTELGDDAWAPFMRYLDQRDHWFPLCAELWLKEDGTIPTRVWFLCFLHHLAGNIGGQSLWAGGATALAEAGIPPYMIKAIGWWLSDAFQIYICQHPILLAALLYSSPLQLLH